MPVDLTDTHCHLTTRQLLPNCREIISEAISDHVTRMITVTCSLEEIPEALALTGVQKGIWIAAGIHPHEARCVTKDDLKQLAEFWREPGIVAAGEMGLDFHYDFSPRDTQQTVFEQQLELARAAEMPVIVHCRKAHESVVKLLTKHGYVGKPVVFHCFSGPADEAAQLRANGWWTSFTGTITFKNAQEQQQACIETPPDQLMFETDAPYLSPEPVRKMRPNKPGNLVHIIRYAAQLRGQSFESVARASTANAINFFGLQ